MKPETLERAREATTALEKAKSMLAWWLTVRMWQYSDSQYGKREMREVLETLEAIDLRQLKEDAQRWRDLQEARGLPSRKPDAAWRQTLAAGRFLEAVMQCRSELGISLREAHNIVTEERNNGSAHES